MHVMSAIRRLRPAPGASLCLLVFPHAGASANFFRAWEVADPDVELRAIQYPGRADRLREPCYTSLEALADDIAEELLAGPAERFTLLGHSMGAAVAYEVARRMQAVGRAPDTLLVSAAQAPHGRDLTRAAARPWNDDEAVEWLVGMGQADREVLSDPRIRQIILSYVRADYEMFQRYEHRPGPALTCDVLAVTGAYDADVTGADAARWRDLTSGRFRHVELPGGHFYFVPDVPVTLFLDPFGAPGTVD